jgi:uncharacterized protein (DUF3084 family)
MSDTRLSGLQRKYSDLERSGVDQFNQFLDNITTRYQAYIKQLIELVESKDKELDSLYASNSQLQESSKNLLEEVRLMREGRLNLEKELKIARASAEKTKALELKNAELVKRINTIKSLIDE